ncbi:MAG: AAA family ATPase, partial [bacterium]
MEKENEKLKKCNFCGEVVAGKLQKRDRKPYIEACPDEKANITSIICVECIAKAAGLFKVGTKPEADNMKLMQSNEQNSKIQVIPPSQIYNELKRHVVSQDGFLRDVAYFSFRHLQRIQMSSNGCDKLPPKAHLWVIGESGTGKSFTMSLLSKIADIPIVICDSTSFTEAGYHGNDVEDALIELTEKGCGKDANGNNVPRGIIVFDEIDKIAAKPVSSYLRDVSGRGVQNRMLSLLDNTSSAIFAKRGDGFTDSRGRRNIDLKHVSVAVMGAFTGIEKYINNDRSVDIGFRVKSKSGKRGCESSALRGTEIINTALIRYLMIPELVGRFQIKCVLNKLDEESLKRILIESESSVI